jgi:hypothetical protein
MKRPALSLPDVTDSLRHARQWAAAVPEHEPAELLEGTLLVLFVVIVVVTLFVIHGMLLRP